MGHALAAPVEQPSLWLLGTLSYILRGGIIVMLLPIVVLPTQVEVRLILGGNLGSGGLAPGFWVALAAATTFSTGLVMVALYALARIEIAAFQRVTGDPEIGTDLRRDPGARLRDLFVLESLTLIVLLLAAVPFAAALGQTTYDEILRPSSAASIYDRVLSQLTNPIVFLAIALPIVDSISAVSVRGVLEGKSVGRALAGSIGSIVRGPISFVATSLVAWLALILVVVVTEWALSVAWQATRAAFLRTTSIPDMLGAVVPVLVAVLLAGVFVCGLAICGYVAGFRNALWTVTSLRRRA